jgi:hypothetical protein
MKINEDFVPATIEEAVDHIVASLDEKDREYLKENGPYGLHHGVGTHMRNSWSFWEDTPLRRDAAKRYKIAMADDLSGLMWEWVVARVRNESFDPRKVCAQFEKHWQDQGGISALKAGGVDEEGVPLKN